MKKIGANWFESASLIITVIVARTPLVGHAAPEVVVWGSGSGGADVPAGLSDLVAIAAGGASQCRADGRRQGRGVGLQL